MQIQTIQRVLLEEGEFLEHFILLYFYMHGKISSTMPAAINSYRAAIGSFVLLSGCVVLIFVLPVGDQSGEFIN